jgi:hypothetical protein
MIVFWTLRFFICHAGYGVNHHDFAKRLWGDMYFNSKTYVYIDFLSTHIVHKVREKKLFLNFFQTEIYKESSSHHVPTNICGVYFRTTLQVIRSGIEKVPFSWPEYIASFSDMTCHQARCYITLKVHWLICRNIFGTLQYYIPCFTFIV